MARRSDSEINNIKNILQLLAKETKLDRQDGTFETSKILKLLKENYNISVSRPTLLNILKTLNFNQSKSNDNKDDAIEWYNKEIEDWKEKSVSAKTYREKKIATEAIDKLRIGKEKLMAIRNMGSQAQYIVKFGEPKVIEIDNQKKQIFKAGNGQATIDECEKKSDVEKDE